MLFEKDNFVSPLKWFGLGSDDFYFTKINASIWVESYQNKTVKFYMQVSIDVDSNGYPIVILINKNKVLELGENALYNGQNLTSIDKFDIAGFWIKKNGNNF